MHSTTFIFGALQIVLIDLLLAGDNALIIALAVRQLPKRERRLATILGAAGAVAMRVALTFVASRALNVEFLKLAGGLFILWIAFKVLVDASEPPAAAGAPSQLLKAVWYVMFADLTMSVDNILAIAGASRGSFELVEHRYDVDDLREISNWWQDRMRRSVQDLPSEWVEAAFSRLTGSSVAF